MNPAELVNLLTPPRLRLLLEIQCRQSLTTRGLARRAQMMPREAEAHLVLLENRQLIAFVYPSTAGGSRKWSLTHEGREALKVLKAAKEASQ